MAMILKQIYFTSDQVNKLNEISTERVNFSEHIRRAIDKYLDELKWKRRAIDEYLDKQKQRKKKNE
jgi:metal-responsive CopG/Arc/MetJ family transcriptional regulator